MARVFSLSLITYIQPTSRSAKHLCQILRRKWQMEDLCVTVNGATIYSSQSTTDAGCFHLSQKLNLLLQHCSLPSHIYLPVLSLVSPELLDILNSNLIIVQNLRRQVSNSFIVRDRVEGNFGRMMEACDERQWSPQALPQLVREDRGEIVEMEYVDEGIKVNLVAAAISQQLDFV